LGGQIFASRHIGSSFGAVRLAGFPGVRVYADNQLIGVTDRSGSVVVPTLRAFERNTIRIDEADLPMDVQIATTELAVRPFARAGAVVSFPVRRERGLLLQVRLEDGSALPPGALVEVEGEAGQHVAASGGEVYLPGGEGRLRLLARWGSQACALSIQVPDSDDPQPRLAGLVCRREANYAAR
jgi:outer membrane usher protein